MRFRGKNSLPLTPKTVHLLRLPRTIGKRKGDDNKFFSPIPKGLRPPAQGWRVTPALGTEFGNGHNANGVAARGEQRIGRNRVAVGDVCRSSPRVVASLQPWALGRNPVGILGTRGGRAGRRNRPVGWLGSSIPT